MYNLTQQEKDGMIARYLAGESARSIASTHEASHTAVTRWLHEWGVDMRSTREDRRLHNGAKHEANHSFFDEIDSEKKAYWLGFILADGCITSGYRLTISLHHKDASHLRQFKSALGADHPVIVREQEPNNYAEFTISSFRLYEALASLGVSPRKSGREKHIQIAEGLQRHYWRGVIDGDGHLNEKQKAVHLIGSLEVVQAFRKYVQSFCPSFKGVVKDYKPSQGVAYIWVRRPAVYKVVSRLYENASVCLSRKQKAASHIAENT